MEIFYFNIAKIADFCQQGFLNYSKVQIPLTVFPIFINFSMNHNPKLRQNEKIINIEGR